MKSSAVFKRILVCMLALTMLSCVVSANVTGMVWAEPETEAPATEAPATDAPVTEAPEADAPEADAPETEAPEILCPECGGSNGAHSSNCPTLIKQYDAQVLAPNGQYYTMTLKGAIPEGLDVIVSALDADFDPEYDIIKKKIAFAFDVSLVDEYGNEWQPADDTVITMTVDAAIAGMAEGESVEVYHIHGGTQKKLGVLTVVDGKISIETTGFSTFFGIQPRTTTASYIYFDLAAGDITITSTTYTGYIYKFGTNESHLVTGNHTAANNYYVYQTNGTNHTTAGFNEVTGLVTTPTYNTVTYDGKDWGKFVTNNSNVESVISGWNSANKDGRVGTPHWISVSGSVSVNLTIDNLWSTKHTKGQGRTDGGIAYVPSGSKKVELNIFFKGDNRFGNVYYASNNTNYSIVFNGDATATLTAADLDLTSSKNWWDSAIGNNDNSGNAKGIIINSGIIYAGTTAGDDCTAIGGGGNGHGIITINGGTVTAVCESSGAAIGGGIGKTDVGGQADVTITGGTVYAYNKSCTSLNGNKNYSATGRKYIPAAAIGGGSSAQKKCNDCTVTITGGWVYAQAVGGTAIGGGSSADGNGGKATVRISGGTVYAKSIAGNISGQDVPAGAAIGGGTGGTKGNGGNAIIYIAPGATVVTGSMGGGETVGDKSIYKIGHAEFYVTGGDIKGQAVMAQGASPCKFEMSSGTWTTNEDTSYIYLRPDGGAVWMNDQHAVATMTGGTITGCMAENGGALYMKAGTFTMSGNSKIEKCSATANGGAVYLGGGTATLSAGSIESCHAQTGGAIFLAGGTAYVSGGNIKNCYSQNIDAVGGGLYVSDGNVIMSSGSIDGCMTKDPDGNINGYGGGVYITGGAMSLSGGEVKNNQASVGGGVYLPGGDFNMSGGTLYKNSATDKGGGVYLTDGGNLNMTGGTVLENSATNDGGGVYLNGGNLNLNGATAKIKGNTAVNGAGVYLTGGVPGLYHGTLSENVASSSGGGIYIDKQVVKLSPTGTVLFEKNKATDGAGMYILGDEGSFAGFSVDNSAIGSVEFSGNIATGIGGGVCLSYGDMTITNEQILLYGNEAKNGGGAAILNGNFILSGGSIGNSAKAVNNATNGGGIYVEGGSVTVSGTGTITNNTAENGGGVYLTGGSFTLNGEGAYISANNATNGGGVYLTEINPTLNVGNIINNTAENGGGIFIEEKEVILDPTGKVLFNGNHATNGAGMYINGTNETQAGFSVDNSYENGSVEFSDNRATGSGGGVCVNKGNFTINYDNIDIINNTAVSGGGVAVLSGEFEMNAGSIGENGKPNSSTNGGGIYVEGGNVTVSGTGTITNNTAVNGGGIYVAGTANISGTVEYNTATNGGGAYVSSGNLNLGDGGLFYDNTAENGGGAYVKGGNITLNNGGSFLANSAVLKGGESANGGGFFVEQGTFRMNDGTVAQNTADSGFGGGGYVDGGNFIMAKGTLGGDTEDQANTAIDGGGIYVSDGNVSIYNGTIKNNRATRDGGAIFVSSNDTEVNVIILSGYLLNNIAGECGGGVAIRSKSSHSITVEVGCLMYHDGSAFDYDGDYEYYRLDGAGQHEFCPQVAGNNAGINGGGFFLDSSSSSLYYYCIEENPANPNIANGNTNSYSLDVEGGKVVIGDEGYHKGVVPSVRGNVQLYSTILVNAGKVDVYGDMNNPYFDQKITVDITGAEDYFKDHRRADSAEVVYKIHYFENFEGTGKYIANQYPVVDDACIVEITASTFERTGYKIEGWYAIVDENTTREYKVGTTYNLVELTAEDGMGVEADGCTFCSDDTLHLMLYAKWAKKGYVIKFDSNKPVGAICTGEMDDLPCTQGDPFKLPENKFRCEGYRFKGWALNPYDTEIKYHDRANINEDLTKEDSRAIPLYAIWEICDHVGHLVYTVENGDTIVETCQACDGHIAYAVLSAADVIYDGEPHPATISGDFGTPVWMSKTFKLTYQKTNDPKWDTEDKDGVWAIWKDPTEAVPVHAGEYKVTFTVDTETVSCIYTIEREKWETPVQPEFVSRAEEVDGQPSKMGIGIIKPVASTPSSLPQYEYGVQYKQADGTLTMLKWVNEEFIYTELSNTYYYISARAREDRNHIESDSSTVVTYLSDTAKVIFVYGDGIKITEANSDGDTKFTFIAEPKDGFHKRNWSVSFHENSPEGPAVAFTEKDGKYEMIAAKTGITYYIIISGVAPDAVFETKATQDQVFTDFSNVATLRISRDSAFTVRYTLKNFIPADYGTLKLKFSTSTPSTAQIPAYTKIIMVKDGTYWYCVTNAARSEVALDEFYKMGETVSESTRFVPDSGDTPISSVYQFIFDFSETTNPQTEELIVSLADDGNLDEELSRKIDLSAVANFILECSEFRDNKATISYTYTESSGHASIWNNRKSAIVMTLDGAIPADLGVTVRANSKEIDYTLISGKKFIIPLGALVNGEGTIEVEFNSNLISVSADAKVDIQWMVSDTLADKAPGNGKEVAKVSFDWISLTSKQLPVVKIQGITSPNNATVSELRLCNVQDPYVVLIQTKNIPEEWSLTMYLYRKDTTVGSNSYGRFIYTGYYETLEVADFVRSDLSLKAQEKGTFYLHVVATTGDGENRVIMSEDRYFFIADE